MAGIRSSKVCRWLGRSPNQIWMGRNPLVIIDLGACGCWRERGLSTASQDIVRIITDIAGVQTDTTNRDRCHSTARGKNAACWRHRFAPKEHNPITGNWREITGGSGSLFIVSQGVVPCYHRMV
jgi:hypothetical protein